MRTRRAVTIRVDRGLVELRSPRGRSEGLRSVWSTDDRDGPTALADVLARAREVGAGRTRDLRVVIETARVVFGERRGAADHVGVSVNEDVVGRYERVLRRRRAHGSARLHLGPILRLTSLRPDVPGAEEASSTVVVDRSIAAITLLVIDGGGIRWGRAAPAEDPEAALSALAEAARRTLGSDLGVARRVLVDVARHRDDRAQERSARRFAAAVTRSLADTAPARVGVR
jgi:hypothetical protein